MSEGNSEATAAPKPVRLSPRNRGLYVTLLLTGPYYAAALLCLRQWGLPEPWSRLDIFAGGYLLLSLAWTADATRFHLVILRSREVMREASGLSYDPGMLRWLSLFSLAELLVYVDYAHWRLIPGLAEPWLQGMGLALYLAGAAWIFWTDSYLTRHFASEEEQKRLMTEGPYRLVRHPRYAALIGSRAAFALALGSILGWALLLGWIGIVLRRIRREEAHLRELFGEAYDAYAATTVRLLPGIY